MTTSSFAHSFIRAFCALGAALICLAAPPPHRPAANAGSAPPVPWHAQPIAQFGGLPAAIAVDQARQIAWLGLGPRVVAIDLADRTAPLVIGRSEWLDDFISTLTVDGAVAVALAGWPTDADPRVTLYTLDLAMPSAPRVLGTLTLPGAMRAAAVADGYAYIVREAPTPSDPLREYRTHLVAVDIRDPARPRLVDDDVIPSPADVVDVTIVGGILAVAAREPNPDGNPSDRYRLHLLQLADPAAPEPIATVLDEAWCRFGGGPGADRPDRLYGYGDGGGIVELDLASPAAPAMIRRWPAADIGGWGCEGLPFVIDSAGMPYLAAFDDLRRQGGWLEAVGVARDDQGRRPRHPLTVGPAAVALLGPHALVAEASGDVAIVDTDAMTTTAAVDAGIATLPLFGAPSAIALRDDRADGLLYASLGYGGLSLLSFDRPLDPPVVGRYVDGLSRSSLHVAGGLAAIGRTGLRVGQRVPYVDEAEVVDVTDPATPRPLTAFGDGRFAQLLTAGGGAWLIHGRSGSAGPSRPLGIAPLGKPEGRTGSAMSLDMRLIDGAVVGDRFMAIGTYPPNAVDRDCITKRLAIVDLADPASPRLESELGLGACDPTTNSYVTGGLFLAATDQAVYVGSVLDRPEPPATGVGRSEVAIVEVDDTATPRILARVPLSGTLSSLSAHAGFLFAGTDCASSARGCTAVVDARDAAAAHFIGTLDGAAGEGVVHDGRVYVASGATGVWVFQPPMPWPAPRDAWRVMLPWAVAR